MRRSRSSPPKPRAYAWCCTASRCQTSWSSASSADTRSPSPATSPIRAPAPCAAPPSRCQRIACSWRPTPRTSARSPCESTQTSPRSSATRSTCWPSSAAPRRTSSAPRWTPMRRASSAGDARVERVPQQPSLRRMRRFHVRPDRDLGQNFLIDSNILGVIERAAELGAEDVVLEIGGGLGVLSEHLAERCAHVHVIEVDTRLADALRDATDRFSNVTLHFEDAMRADLALLRPVPTKVVANL